MSPYQLFLLAVLILWPFFILGLLFLMSRLEERVDRSAAGTPEEAGLEPVAGTSEEKEVTIGVGDQVIGSGERRTAPSPAAPGRESPL
jgi:hypothetical protein